MKMKKMVTTTVLSVLAFGLVAPTALAESANSKGKVQFELPGNPTPKPVDPTVKEPEEIEVDPERPGTDGHLRFDRVPQFDFGKITLSNSAVDAPVLQDVYKRTATGTTIYAAPTVQVTDGRGTQAGWSTRVKIGNFELVDANDATIVDPTQFLVGAEVSIGGATALPHTKDGSITVADAPQVKTNFKMKATDQVFASAAATKGMGQWSISYHDGDVQVGGANDGYPNEHATQGNEESIRLAIPESSKKLANREYRAQITWTISDTVDTITP